MRSLSFFLVAASLSAFSSTADGAAEASNNDQSCAASTNDWDEMHRRIVRDSSQSGAFLAALDQSGGSTPKALELYGISTDEYEINSER